MVQKKLLYTLASIILTIFFIYILFPYALVTEVGISKIQSYLNQMNVGLKIQAGSLSSYWLTGVQVKKLQISSQEQPKNLLNIDKFTIRMSIMPIIIGRVNINSDIKIDGGEGAVFVSISLFDLISGKLNIKEINADFDNLKLDNIFNQLISVVKNSKNPGMSLLIPIIANSTLGGFLNGTIDYENKEHYPSQINLKIKNAFLDINNETLDIPKQTFTAANIHAEYLDSVLTLKKETAFTAQNISFSGNGTVKSENGKNSKQTLNMKLSILVSGQVEKNFGFLLPQLLKCPSSAMIGGIMNVQLRGPLDKFSCQL